MPFTKIYNFELDEIEDEEEDIDDLVRYLSIRKFKSEDHAKYKDDYSTTMEIRIFDVEGNLIQSIKLYEAFPSTMKDFDLSWDAVNELIRTDIMITFKEFSIVSSTLEKPIQKSGQIGINSSQLSVTTNSL